MNTGLTSVTTPTSRYWGMLKGLSDREKQDLIVLLSASMTKSEPTEKNNSKWASRYVGVWKDSRSADEIVRDIRNARTANTFDVEL